MSYKSAGHSDREQTTGRIDPAATSLMQFFDALFAPLKLAGKAEMIPHYRSSIGWLAKALGRPPTVADLTPANLRQALKTAAAAGIQKGRLKTLRTHLGNLHKYAHALGIIEQPYQCVRLPKIKPAEQTAAGGPLRKFYQQKVRPGLLQRVGSRQLCAHDRAVVHFETFIAAHWQGQPITVATLDAFCDQLAGEGKRPATVQHYRDCLRRVLKQFCPEIAWPRCEHAPAGDEAATDPVAAGDNAGANGNEPAPNETPRRRKRNFRLEIFGPRPQLPPPTPGSVRALYFDKFLPQRLLDAEQQSPQSYERMLECFYLHCGGDVPVKDLTDDLLLGYLQRFREAGCSPNTFNNERARFVALWNFAFVERLIDVQPRVRKLKVYRDPPEAWTEEEIRELLARCDIFAGKQIGPIAKDAFWRALLLVTYWTAARRGGLLSIRREDVNLERACVRIRGRSQKTRQGQVFRVGPECIGAIREIWEPERELLFALPNAHHKLSHDFRRLKAAAGLENDGRSFQQFHRVRRTAATYTAKKAGLQAAAMLCGHASPTLTRDHYVDPTLVETSVSDYLNPLLPADDAAGNDDNGEDAATDRFAAGGHAGASGDAKGGDA